MGSEPAINQNQDLPEKAPEIVASDGKELLNPKELGEKLNVEPSTIYYWASIRYIPYYKLGKHIRFRWSEIEEWMKERKQKVRWQGKHLL